MIELDMEMPATCSDCPIYDGEYGWCNVDHNIHTNILDPDERPENCPLKERNKGKWEIYVISMIDGEGCRCSECEFEGVPYWDFCPNCGAKMEEVLKA